MNEKTNLVEILKDCPQGTKLWSPIYGDVTLLSVIQENDYSIVVKTQRDTTASFDEYGIFNKLYDNAVCLLFPSKENRDWSKFQQKKSKFDPKSFEPFDKVLARDANNRDWLAMFFSHIHKGMIIANGCKWAQVIPYNDKTKHLVGTIKEAPEFYRYWED